MTSRKLISTAAAAAAAAALAVGAFALGSSNSDGATGSQAAAFGQPPAGAPAGAPNGAMPPGFGEPVTGSTATKVADAATAKYPGEVDRVMKLGDGSYVAHVITSTGELHVTVSKDFEVTGSRQGGPGGGGTSGDTTQS